MGTPRGILSRARSAQPLDETERREGSLHCPDTCAQAAAVAASEDQYPMESVACVLRGPHRNF
jgi:hypothetical protein